MGQMFMGCETLTTVQLPTTGMNSLDELMFQKCVSLNNVLIPSNVRTVSYSVFQGCIALRTYSIPNSVTKIADTAFGKTFCCPTLNSSGCNIDAGDSTCNCKACHATTRAQRRSTATMAPPRTKTVGTTPSPRTDTIAPTKAANARRRGGSTVLHVMLALAIVGLLAGVAAFVMHRFKAKVLSNESSYANTHQSPLTQQFVSGPEETEGLLEANSRADARAI